MSAFPHRIIHCLSILHVGFGHWSSSPSPARVPREAVSLLDMHFFDLIHASSPLSDMNSRRESHFGQISVELADESLQLKVVLSPIVLPPSKATKLTPEWSIQGITSNKSKRSKQSARLCQTRLDKIHHFNRPSRRSSLATSAPWRSSQRGATHRR
jgi:hypothetical protein